MIRHKAPIRLYRASWQSPTTSATTECGVSLSIYHSHKCKKVICTVQTWLRSPDDRRLRRVTMTKNIVMEEVTQWTGKPPYPSFPAARSRCCHPAATDGNAIGRARRRLSAATSVDSRRRHQAGNSSLHWNKSESWSGQRTALPLAVFAGRVHRRRHLCSPSYLPLVVLRIASQTPRAALMVLRTYLCVPR